MQSFSCYFSRHHLTDSPLLLFGRHVVAARHVALLVIIIVTDDPLEVGTLEFLEYQLVLQLTVKESSIRESAEDQRATNQSHLQLGN